MYMKKKYIGHYYFLISFLPVKYVASLFQVRKSQLKADISSCRFIQLSSFFLPPICFFLSPWLQFTITIIYMSISLSSFFFFKPFPTYYKQHLLKHLTETSHATWLISVLKILLELLYGFSHFGDLVAANFRVHTSRTDSN